MTYFGRCTVDNLTRSPSRGLAQPARPPRDEIRSAGRTSWSRGFGSV